MTRNRSPRGVTTKQNNRPSISPKAPVALFAIVAALVSDDQRGVPVEPLNKFEAVAASGPPGLAFGVIPIIARRPAHGVFIHTESRFCKVQGL